MSEEPIVKPIARVPRGISSNWGRTAAVVGELRGVFSGQPEGQEPQGNDGGGGGEQSCSEPVDLQCGHDYPRLCILRHSLSLLEANPRKSSRLPKRKTNHPSRKRRTKPPFPQGRKQRRLANRNKEAATPKTPEQKLPISLE